MTAFAAPSGALDIGLDPMLEPEREMKKGVTDIDWTVPEDVAQLSDWLWRNRDYKRRIEEQAIRNIAYVLGDQNRKLNRRTMTMEPDHRRPRWEIKHSYNEILPALQQRLANLQRVNTEWGTPPLTDDPEDQVVARMLRNVSNFYYHQKLKFPSVVTKAIMWSMMTKVGFIELNWDPKAGERKIATPQDFAPVNPETGEPDMEAGVQEFIANFGEQAADKGFAVQFTGDLFADAFPIFEMITWPFLELEWSRMLIWMRTKMVTVTQAASESGLPVERIKTIREQEKMDRSYQKRLTTGSGYYQRTDDAPARTSHAASDYDPDSEMVFRHQLYLSKDYDPDTYPEGMTAVVIGDIALPKSIGPIPFPTKRPPYFVIHEHDVEGSLYGTCTVDQMRSPQDDLNSIMNDAANYRRRTMNPTIFTFPGSIMAGQRFNNAPAQIIKCADKDSVPVILDRPDLPTDYDRTLRWTLQLLNDVSGVADIDRGRTQETRVTSGVAIQALQEKNQARMGPIAQSIRQVVAETGMFAMELLQEFADDQRLISIVGEDNASEVVMFDRHSITPKSGDANRAAMIRIDTTGGLPAGRAEMMNMINILAERGFLRPQEHDSIVFKALAIGEITNIIDKDRVDTTSETHALEAMRNGKMPIPPRDTAKFADRLEVLRKWINSDEYVQTVRQFGHIHEIAQARVQLLKQGLVDQEVEILYLQRMADLRMQAKYIRLSMESAKRGEIDPQMALQVFGIPLGLQAAQAEAQDNSQKGVQKKRPAGRSQAPDSKRKPDAA